MIDLDPGFLKGSYPPLITPFRDGAVGDQHTQPHRLVRGLRELVLEGLPGGDQHRPLGFRADPGREESSVNPELPADQRSGRGEGRIGAEDLVFGTPQHADHLGETLLRRRLIEGPVTDPEFDQAA